VDGKKVFHGMPKRAFMAMSQEGQEAMTANPNARIVAYKSEQVQEKALFRLFDFMKGNCFTAKPFVLKPSPEMVDTMELYRAGRLFFKSDLYLKGLYYDIHRYLEEGTMPSFCELNVICKLNNGAEHKLYKFAVAVMSSYRYQGFIIDKEAFESWLEKHPAFGKAMDAYAAEKQAQKDQQRSDLKARLQVRRANSRAPHRAAFTLPAVSPLPMFVEVRDLRKPSMRKGYKQPAKKDSGAEDVAQEERYALEAVHFRAEASTTSFKIRALHSNQFSRTIY
jgi:hypothetical protein